MELPYTKGHVPHWLVPPPLPLDPVPPPVPGWLSPPAPVVKPTAEGRALMLTRFESAFPYILERITAGKTLTDAVEEYPGGDLDLGVFTTWMLKDPQRKALYQEAKEVRAETWTGTMVKHALGETPHDLDRSKFVVDTLKWLVARHARKEYGDTKTVEMNTTISVRAAMEQAEQRVIDVQVIEDDD